MIKRAHVRQFLAIVETGGFTAAASRLNVTQPTLSAGIAEMERELGASLLYRERRGVRLTEAGNRLLIHARAIEREFQLVETGTAGVAQAAPPPLRIGTLPTLATSQLARLCDAYRVDRPLVLVEGSDAELRRKLMAGQIDAALTLLREGEQVGPVLDEGYAMMLPETHRLAGRTRLKPEELADETMIARRSCEILSETSRFFTQRGVRPRFFLRSSNDDRCMALVRNGMGITTAPASLAVPGIIALPLDGYDFRRRIGLIGGRDRAVPPGLIEAWGIAQEA